MAKWFHPEVNGIVDVFPKDEADEQTLRRSGLIPEGEAVIESDESYEASTAILQAQPEKRKPGRPRKS